MNSTATTTPHDLSVLAAATPAPDTGTPANKSDAVMQRVATAIIESIEQGIVDGEWKKPWANGTIATNAVTGNQYRGGNLFALWMFGSRYQSGLWATYRQWASLDAQVRKGERGTTLIKWNTLRCKTHSPEESCPTGKCGRMFPNVFTVFNAGQVDGFTPSELTANTESRIADAEAFVAATGADIRHTAEGMAYYTRQLDTITLPHFETFFSAEAYYATAAHELTHWTGHESRLNRDLSGKWQDDAYAAEELVAELGSAMLCAHLGLSEHPRPDHAQYLQQWVRRLKGDHRLLWSAMTQAQKAVDYLLVSSTAK